MQDVRRQCRSLMVATVGLAFLTCACTDKKAKSPPTSSEPPPIATTTSTTSPHGFRAQLLAVPVTGEFRRDPGVRVEIHDGHENAAMRFSSEERVLLENVLHSLPIGHVSGLKYVGVLPSTVLQPGDSAGGYSGGDFLAYIYREQTIGSSVEKIYLLDGFQPVPGDKDTVPPTHLRGPALIFPGDSTLRTFTEVTLHEIGHITQNNYVGSDQRIEWIRALFAPSTEHVDFAPPSTGGPPNQTGPYGKISPSEDFATAYAEFAARPSEAFLAALDVLQNSGRSFLFQKYLYMTALFTDSASRTIQFTQLNTRPMSLRQNPSMYRRTPSSLEFQAGSVHLRMAINSANEIFRIEYTDGRGVTQTITPNPPILLLQTIQTRMPLTQASATSVSSERSSERRDVSGPLISTPAEIQQFLEDFVPAQVISPNPPTHYVPVCPPRGPPQLSFEELIRPHGNFRAVSPSEKASPIVAQ